MNAPTKRLQEFCKEFSISWEKLDYLVMQADNIELDILNTGTTLEKQLLINKLLANDSVYSTD